MDIINNPEWLNLGAGVVYGSIWRRLETPKSRERYESPCFPKNKNHQAVHCSWKILKAEVFGTHAPCKKTLERLSEIFLIEINKYIYKLEQTLTALVSSEIRGDNKPCLRVNFEMTNRNGNCKLNNSDHTKDELDLTIMDLMESSLYM